MTRGVSGVRPSGARRRRPGAGPASDSESEPAERPGRPGGSAGTAGGLVRFQLELGPSHGHGHRVTVMRYRPSHPASWHTTGLFKFHCALTPGTVATIAPDPSHHRFASVGLGRAFELWGVPARPTRPGGPADRRLIAGPRAEPLTRIGTVTPVNGSVVEAWERKREMMPSLEPGETPWPSDCPEADTRRDDPRLPDSDRMMIM